MLNIVIGHAKNVKSFRFLILYLSLTEITNGNIIIRFKIEYY